MNEQIEPIYLVAKNVIQHANQFKNVNILNENIPPQFVLSTITPSSIATTSNANKIQFVELKPPLPSRLVKQTTKKSRKQQTIDQIINLKEQLEDFFSLQSTELKFRLVILFVIYISIIYNLFRSLAALYLIESNFRFNYHYLSPSRRTIYSFFMFFNLFVDCYGVYTLLKKNIVHIFFYAICLTAFSLILLIGFGFLAGLTVILSLFIACLCYLFTYVEYKEYNQQETTGVCSQCVHHLHQV